MRYNIIGMALLHYGSIVLLLVVTYFVINRWINKYLSVKEKQNDILARIADKLEK